MDRKDKYLRLLTEAYQGEFYGVVMMETAAALATEEDRKKKCLVLCDFEQRVLDHLAPLAEKYGLPDPDEAYLARARKRGESFGTGEWGEELRGFGETVDTCIREYEGLEPLGPEEDYAYARILVEHERVLGDFVRREIAGDAASLEKVHAFLQERETP